MPGQPSFETRLLFCLERQAPNLVYSGQLNPLLTNQPPGFF